MPLPLLNILNSLLFISSSYRLLTVLSHQRTDHVRPALQRQRRECGPTGARSRPQTGAGGPAEVHGESGGSRSVS